MQERYSAIYRAIVYLNFFLLPLFVLTCLSEVLEVVKNKNCCLSFQIDMSYTFSEYIRAGIISYF
jgi:hypothetical protein